MLTLEEAKTIAEDKLNSMPVLGDVGGLTIIDNATIEKPYAWIFFYNSKQFIETGNIMDALGGNAPLFISKFTGHIATFATGQSIDKMIDEYEEREKIWELVLTEDIYSDTPKLLVLKKTLGLSNDSIADYKNTNRLVLETGSKTRLSSLKQVLNDMKIKAQIIKRNISG
jgi:hypothetical protein